MGWLKDLLGGKEKVQPLSINDSNYRDEVLESPVPVLLDVWTPTCVHCHRLEPIIMGLAQRYHGRLKVTEVNGEEAPGVMQSLGVRGTPTVVYFNQGREVERVTGFRGSLYHQDFIENELLSATNAEHVEGVAS